jgi:adenylate kinase family enzyme
VDLAWGEVSEGKPANGSGVVALEGTGTIPEAGWAVGLLPPILARFRRCSWNAGSVQRVAVIGCGGAGKSTLAGQIGQRLNLPVVHLGEYYWQPGWRPTDPAARQAKEQLIAADSWIIDGNYLSTLELRVSVADTVVLLDLPAWRCAWRATWRVLIGRDAANTAAGCPERLDRRHLRFLRYIWRFPQTARPRLLHRLAQHEDTTKICRLTAAQVRRFATKLGP